ncbi:MAG: N-acetylneuraminate synthase family protein [Reichenbachiella sp.]|uniref:N-acetylneuraminate synthase family protein n=1 Tax=Reichenbachiella sp. TaxID=2184521 RepID=UPI003262E955
MTYVIGEIGQNHNGSMDVARQLIDVAARPVIDDLFNRELKKMDAVKLTKRDLKEELSGSAMRQPYTSEHSFGNTYGEHRAALELDDVQHYELYQYAKSKGLDFIETFCAIGCLSLLDKCQPDFLKVASRDLTNLPLLEALAQTEIPIILSTGMAGKEELDQALEVINKFHEKISILHCLSQYPSEYQNINLNTIPYLKENYPEYKIGYSDHSIGIMVPVAAVAMGAEIVEKHITLDRSMKGSDQAGSLAPDGIHRMMRDIRNLEMSFGKHEMYVENSIKSTRTKLERSIASKRPIRKGEKIEKSDLHLLSPGDGFKWIDKDQVIGKVALDDIEKDEIIYKDQIQ